MRRAPSLARACVFGREAFIPGNVTCVSCRRQEVECPFAPALPVVAATPPPEEKSGPKVKGPNKTEAEYGRRLGLEFPGAEVRYEPLSLVIDLDGERFGYKPDWGVISSDGRILLVEVKNAGYQFASYGRAKLAFAACRVQWPMFSYRWAEKDGGAWKVTDFPVSLL